MSQEGVNVAEINEIIKKTISILNMNRGQIYKILEDLREQHQQYEQELVNVREEIETVTQESISLEKEDGFMRKRLSEVFKQFTASGEEEAKATYEKASEVRFRFMVKVNREKELRERMRFLEAELVKSAEKIVNAEKVVSQISIALGYLDGDIQQVFDGADKNPEMSIGVKILEAQENERKRIARDIHDGPAQHVANAVMQADICKKIFQRDIEEGFKELTELKGNMEYALKEVRNIIFDLRPMSLDDLGLHQTVQLLVNSFEKETGIAFKSDIKPVYDEVEPIIQVAVYRVMQEILNNVKKHSKAKHVMVRLDFGSEYLLLVISDDGIGFNVEETLNQVKTKGGNYGLMGLIDRVEQLQGEIRIESTVGKGTVFKVTLPVSREIVRNG